MGAIPGKATRPIPTRALPKPSCAVSSRRGRNTCVENPMSTSKLQDRLLEDVVIFENRETQKTGAQSIAPDHSPRQRARSGPLPARAASLGPDAAPSLQHRVE